jgi:hypothetical protein
MQIRAGDRVGMVGFFPPLLKYLRDTDAELVIIEKNPQLIERYLRLGVGRCFYASAKVVRLGGRIASVQMELKNDTDLLIATGTAAYIVS